MPTFAGGGGLSLKGFLIGFPTICAFLFFDEWMRERGKDPDGVYWFLLFVAFLVAIAYFYRRRIRYEKADIKNSSNNRAKGLPENWHKMSPQEQQLWLDANNRSWDSTVD